MQRSLSFRVGLAIVAGTFFGASELVADVDEDTAHRAVAFGLSSSSAMLARADLAFAKSLVNPVHYRGALGETVAEKVFVREVLSKSRAGNWRSITPRSGRQGLDHLFIKTDKNGRPIDMIVGESKYNTSKLARTTDGNIQGSKTYTAKRLKGLASRYRNVATGDAVEFRNAPLNSNRQIDVVLKNGKVVSFWKESSVDKAWKFTGTRDQLEEAKNQSGALADFFEGAADGKITYRSRVFHVKPRGNDIVVDIYDAKNVESVGKIEGLKKTGSFTVKNAMLKSHGTQTEIARTLKSQVDDLSDSDARNLAARICRTTPARQLMTRSSFASGVFLKSGMAAGAGVVLDLLAQSAFSGEIDFGRLGLSTGSIFAGTSAGQLVHASSIKYSLIRNSMAASSRATRIPVTAISAGVSGVAAGTIATALFSYGSYFMGGADLATANKDMAAGLTGTGAGVLTSMGLLGFAGAYGTAGTGVAISTLHGAAATNAALAWLGGGTLASGGGGVAVGSVVVGGVVVIAAIAATGAVYYCYHRYDTKKEKERITKLFKKHSNPETIEELIRYEEQYN